MRRARIFLGFALALTVGLAFSTMVARSQDADRPVLPDGFEQPITALMAHIQRHFVEPMDRDQLLLGAYQGLLTEADPRASYWSAQMVEEFGPSTDSHIEELGMRFRYVAFGDVIVVEGTTVGGPAFQAGLLAGDVILEVRQVPDGETVKTEDLRDLWQVLKALRGEPGTQIALTVLRSGYQGRSTLTLTRGHARPPAVLSLHVVDAETGTAYLQLARFDADAAGQMAAALAALVEQGATGVVVDLRFCSGGDPQGAIPCADMLLGEGVIATVRGPGGTETILRSEPAVSFPDLPLVLLANRYTAGSAEVFAGALRDRERADLVGEITLGIASIRSTVPNPYDGGAVVLTAGRYHTPNGNRIEGAGVAPDVEVTLSHEDGRRLAEQVAERVAELLPEAGPRTDAAEDEFEDVQLERALAVLTGEDMPQEDAGAEVAAVETEEGERFPVAEVLRHPATEPVAEPQLLDTDVVPVAGAGGQARIGGPELRQVTHQFLEPLAWLIAEVERHAAEPLDTEESRAEFRRDLLTGAYRGMLDACDRYSVYWPPEILREFEDDLEGEFGGLGISIRFDPDRKAVVVERPIPYSPAHRAGIGEGDLIVKVLEVATGVVTETKEFDSVHDAVRILRGKVGAEVVVTVVAADGGPDRDVSVVRDKIKIPGVRAVEMIDPEGVVGYIFVPYFSKPMVPDLDKAVSELLGKGAKGLILDFRYNPGGLLSAAEACSDLFLAKNDPIVVVKKRHGRDEAHKAQIAPRFGEVPLVLLVDRHSASGAEIVAAALHDNGRAVLVGESTYGKASVQQLFPFGEGAVKLTIARYYTPGDVLIEGKGVAPDIEVRLSDEDTRLLGRHLMEKGAYPPLPEDAEPEEGDAGEEPEEEFQDVQLDRALEAMAGLLADGSVVQEERQPVGAAAGG